jgi:hypothetical protein
MHEKLLEEKEFGIMFQNVESDQSKIIAAPNTNLKEHSKNHGGLKIK